MVSSNIFFIGWLVISVALFVWMPEIALVFSFLLLIALVCALPEQILFEKTIKHRKETIRKIKDLYEEDDDIY